uniref:RING-type domain-containing protein n=1 Tax=Physcomitrium patens TaxID=3218 RepID=A0A7I4BCT9_PHYPA
MAAVWRNAGSSGALESGSRSAQVDIIPDDSCDICMGEDGACDIWFSPCAHKACASCVQKMRIANVYKADKGVKCPFCRQLIESYLDSPPLQHPAYSPFPPESASFNLVTGRNPEQVSKAVAETSVKKPYGRGGIVSIGGGNDYIPPKGVTGSDGGGLRSSTRMDDLLPGYVVPPLKDTDDIVSMAMDRTGARHLDFMLRDGYPKRHKVAKLCREMLTPFSAKLAVHASGNYVLQRMLEYAATHRGEGGNTESFFTSIVRSFCLDKGLVMAAQDHRGTFSVQKMLVSVKGTEEANLVATCIQGSVVQLALDQYGVYVLERLVEAMITSLNPAPGKKARVPSKVAMKILAQICEEMHTDSASLACIAKHQVSGLMLVECIRWALPQPEALTAAVSLAKLSSDLVGFKLSHRTLQGVLSLEVKEVAEHVIQGLQGHYVELASDTIGFGFKLVRACLATPCVGEDMRLLVVNELLDGVIYPSAHHSLIDNTAGCEMLAFGLCLLSRRILDERLDKMIMFLEQDKCLVFRDRVETMRKHFFNETPPPNIQLVPASASPASFVPSVTRVCSLDLSSSNSGNDVGCNSLSGYSRVFQGQPMSDPWSEEAPPGGVFSLEHVEKPLTRVGSMPHVRPATSSSRLASPEHNYTGESSGVENSTSNTMGSPSGGTLGGRGSSNQSGSSTHTPPQLRDRNVITVPGHNGVGSSHSQLSSLEGSLLPYGSSDFLDYNSDPVESPTYAGPKKTSEQDVLSEAAKSSGSQRQPGICAVCYRDAANTVLLNCSHMCCCTVCSRAVKLCPICNNKVTNVIDIRPVGMPPSPSSSLPAQIVGSNAWDMSRMANSVSSIVNNLVDVSNGAIQFREGPSRPSSASSQYQGSEPGRFEGSTVNAVNQHYPFRHFSPDQPPPGIPVPKQSPVQSGSTVLRSTSPQTITPMNASPITSISMGGARPLFLPSDFYPQAIIGNGAAGSTFSSYSIAAPSFNQHMVPSSSVNSAATNLNGSALNLPAAAAAVTSPIPGRRAPAPYRPPGLYRPPDLFTQPAVSAETQSNNSSVMSDFANMVPSQWRTYQ